MSAATRIKELLVLATSVALGVLWMGCSALGESGGVPDGLPHGGTGAFRFLTSMETGITSPLVGRAIVLRTGAVGAFMATPSYLVYAFRETVDEPPMQPEDHPPGELFLPAFHPSAIHLGPARDGIAYDAGPVVFEAVLPWQGGEVYDPWILEGSTDVLFYACPGGIGLALPSVFGEGGGFDVEGDGPIIGPDPVTGAVPRRPSALLREDVGRVFLYFELDGEIRLATSEDGANYRISDELTFEGEDEGASPEIAMGAPGILALETSAGRTVYRLYFESRREDGTTNIYLAGSEDGLSFVRHPRPVIDTAAARAPAPLTLDAQKTLLFVNQPFSQRGLQTRAAAVAVTPGGVSLAPDEP